MGVSATAHCAAKALISLQSRDYSVRAKFIVSHTHESGIMFGQ